MVKYTENNKPILIGKKDKQDESFLGQGIVIEKWWIENGEIRIWKRSPNVIKSRYTLCEIY